MISRIVLVGVLLSMMMLTDPAMASVEHRRLRSPKSSKAPSVDSSSPKGSKAPRGKASTGTKAPKEKSQLETKAPKSKKKDEDIDSAQSMRAGVVLEDIDPVEEAEEVQEPSPLVDATIENDPDRQAYDASAQDIPSGALTTRKAVNPDSEDSQSNEKSKYTTSTATCDLECAHGGYCTLRRESIPNNVREGNLIEMCVCPLGYTGLACDEIVDQCQYPSRTCHNGMPCSRITDGSGQESYTCDCAVADSISDFAGKMCRNPITEYCGNTRYRFHAEDMPDSFCTNGGRCRSDFLEPSDSYTLASVTPNTNKDTGDAIFTDESQGQGVLRFQHRGCVCPPEFYGPHCEYINLPGVAMNVGGDGHLDDDPKALARSIVWSSSVVALVAFSTCAGSLLLLWIRRRKNKRWTVNEHDDFNLHSFRDDPTSAPVVPPRRRPRQVAAMPEQDMGLWGLIQSTPGGFVISFNRIWANAQGTVETDMVSDLDNMSEFCDMDNDDSSGAGNSANTSLPVIPMVQSEDDDEVYKEDGDPLHIYEDDQVEDTNDDKVAYVIPNSRLV